MITPRWTTLLMDDAGLRDMPELPPEAVFTHAEDVAASRPGPVELYRRWERQQWSAADVELGPDAEELATLPAPVRRAVLESITTFIVGEYTGLDILGPILVGSPDEEYSVFLGTQIADETRHTHLMLRLGEEVAGYDPDPHRMLAQAWRSAGPAHQDLALLEGQLVRELLERPRDYGRWLRAVVLFHFITEGILALVGQRALVRTLRRVDALPGIRTAYTAMCRDESRHVGFGTHALRVGMLEGHQDDIYEVLERAVPIAMEFDGRGERASAPFRAMCTDLVRKHLSSIGGDPVFADHLVTHAGSARVG
ncbi:ribonucleotide reductase small subunit [Pseudonocardia sediminis]|uniref:Ribonucleotide reductase small subunit n=1 Tax=Pseudonocardia sediminis TaxID=1397368 RepID=A0A4Q7V7D4_PSEST|nr:ribonucleotide-diphosphate reductase subunit beta [Pseudonocardia sediminis]RZT88659.1 ribonucleotide reductase small subunit [Pseudonocardia sediminis]